MEFNHSAVGIVEPRRTPPGELRRPLDFVSGCGEPLALRVEVFYFECNVVHVVGPSWRGRSVVDGMNEQVHAFHVEVVGAPSRFRDRLAEYACVELRRRTWLLRESCDLVDPAPQRSTSSDLLRSPS